MFAFASEIFPFMICFLPVRVLPFPPYQVPLTYLAGWWSVVAESWVHLGSSSIPPSVLDADLARQVVLGWRTFPFCTWVCRATPFWPVEFLLKNQLISLMGSPLMVSHCVSLSTFEIPSSLIFDIWIMCHSVGLLRFTLLGTVWAFWPGWLFPSLDWGSFPFLLFK